MWLCVWLWVWVWMWMWASIRVCTSVDECTCGLDYTCVALFGELYFFARGLFWCTNDRGRKNDTERMSASERKTFTKPPDNRCRNNTCDHNIFIARIPKS